MLASDCPPPRNHDCPKIQLFAATAKASVRTAKRLPFTRSAGAPMATAVMVVPTVA